MVKPIDKNKEPTADKPFVINANYEIFNLAVVVLSLVNLPLLWLLPLPDQKNVILIMELVISVYLFIDAGYRFARAPGKTHFLWSNQGWLYFVGSLPVPLFRLARLVPVGLSIHRLRRSDYIQMGGVVLARPAHSVLYAIILGSLAVLEVGSLWILSAENGAPNANIKTASDALWWGIVTIGTVGYGDRYPVTNDGRIVGVVVIITGVALFTTLTSFLAQSFIKGPQPAGKVSATQSAEPPADLAGQLRALQQAMEQRDAEQTRLIKELQEQVKALHRTPVDS